MRYQFCDLKPNDLDFQTCASGFSGAAISVDGSFKYCHVQFGEEQISGATIFDDVNLVDMIAGGNTLKSINRKIVKNVATAQFVLADVQFIALRKEKIRNVASITDSFRNTMSCKL